MALPLSPPLLPQLARPRAKLPEDGGWAYEPKWDGFRAIAFVDGAETHLQSRNGKSLSRYFPEVTFPEGRYVLDGEIVASSFGTLGQRIHPAASRVARLAEETPARFVAFDLLARDDDVLLELPYEERRAALEEVPGLGLTPVVRSADEAQGWLRDEEGVIAKELAAPYLPGERKGMVKVKRVRTIDTVVMGWRPGKEEGTVGAIILGLYDEGGGLHEVGHSSGFTAKRKRELVSELQPYETGERGSRRAVALDARARPGMGRSAARARRGDHLRPRLRRAHPPRDQGAALARRQGPARVPGRAAGVLAAPAWPPRRSTRWPRSAGASSSSAWPASPSPTSPGPCAGWVPCRRRSSPRRSGRWPSARATVPTATSRPPSRAATSCARTCCAPPGTSSRREDVRWLLRLTGPRVHALNRYYNARFGLDAAVLTRGHDVLAGALGDGEALTRAALAERLAEAGIEAEGPRLAYLLMHAELEEVICSGPRRGRQQTYALFDARVPPGPLDDLPRDRALEELVLRYFRSHGPATVRDFTAWSSLAVADTKAALERAGPALAREEDEDGTAWYAAPQPGTARSARAGRAFLLGMYDETIIGYRDLHVVLAHPSPRPGLLERAIVIAAARWAAGSAR